MGLTIVTAVWAVFVALSWWSPIRAGRWGVAAFLLSVTVNEVPIVLLVVFVASLAAQVPTALTWNDWLPAALAGFVLVGLVWLQVRAASSWARLAAAMGMEPAKGGGWGVWAGGILLPFQRHRRGVRRHRNLAYGSEGRAHRLDVYRGSDQSQERPIVIHLHGGGFVQGGKSRESVVLLNQLAAHGWLCISANYRLRAAGVFPHSLVDAKRVIVWAKEHAAEYGADPTQIFLVGTSAGGHLALSAALTQNDPELQPGFEDRDTRVAGVVILYGYLGPRTTDPSSSPAALVHPDAPPALMIHGSHDSMVASVGPRSVATALRDVSRAPVVWIELPHTQHNFDLFASVRARMVANATLTFLERVRTRG